MARAGRRRGLGRRGPGRIAALRRARASGRATAWRRRAIGRRRTPALSPRHALVLGAIQGPAELLPVSSSGHLVLVPELMGWRYVRLDPELRKAFEVALHAGTAAALIVAMRDEIVEVVRGLDGERVIGAALAFAPPAVAGLMLEDGIERRAGTPCRVAVAQVVAGLALAGADRRPSDRPYAAAGTLDHLLLGLAQAAALAPGVSRNGATLTLARMRRLDRAAASRLSRHAALPVIAGAGLLKSVRLARRGLSPELRAAFAVGAGASAISTLAFQGLLAWTESARSYAPVAVYRVAFGALALHQLGGRARTLAARR